MLGALLSSEFLCETYYEAIIHRGLIPKPELLTIIKNSATIWYIAALGIHNLGGSIICMEPHSNTYEVRFLCYPEFCCVHQKSPDTLTLVCFQNREIDDFGDPLISKGRIV